MAMKYVILLYLLTFVKTDTPLTEEVTLTPDIGAVRVARHPKLLQIVNPSHFDYASITQQDPLKMRYAQQQEVDSYVRAYRLQQQARRPVKVRKQSPKNHQTIGQNAKETYGELPKIDNVVRDALKQNIHSYPGGDTLSDYEMKVVDPKYSTHSSNTFSNSDKSHKAVTPVSNHQKLTVVRGEEKVPKKTLAADEVGEQFVDQETEASETRESRIYVGTEDLLKSAQYGAPLSANYLAKPMYVLANPQLQLDPKLFAQGLASYALPENHQLRAEGFEQASKTDLDALNALLGKAPTDQLQGLNHLLGQQVENLQEPVPVLPQKQAFVDVKELAPQSEALVGLKDYGQNQAIVDLKDLIQQYQTNVGLADLVQQHQTNVGLADLVQQHQTNVELADLVQQTHANIELKDLIQQTQLVPEDQVYVQPEADIGLKDHTPIEEEVADFANTQSKPNVKIEVAQVEAKNNIDQQLALARESKTVYGKDEDNLQYAARYAFGYKIRDYHSGNDFGHEEIREGDVAKGRYHVLLPDGRLQNVEYWADPSGYHAKVTYSLVDHQ